MNEKSIPSFIEALHNGDICVPDRRVRPDSAYQEKAHRRAVAGEAFRSTLSPQQEALFEAYRAADVEAVSDELLDRFLLGFRLGGQCVYDVFISTEAPFDSP